MDTNEFLDLKKFAIEAFKDNIEGKPFDREVYASKGLDDKKIETYYYCHQAIGFLTFYLFEKYEKGCLDDLIEEWYSELMDRRGDWTDTVEGAIEALESKLYVVDGTDIAFYSAEPSLNTLNEAVLYDIFVKALLLSYEFAIDRDKEIRKSVSHFKYWDFFFNPYGDESEVA